LPFETFLQLGSGKLHEFVQEALQNSPTMKEMEVRVNLQPFQADYVCQALARNHHVESLRWGSLAPLFPSL
jgi:hypothetical protein